MFSDILSDLPIFFIGTSLVTTASYAAATVLGKNPELAAKVAAISSLVFCLYRDCVEYYSGLDKASRNALYITGIACGGSALIAALYNYELVSVIGVAILGTSLVLANTAACTLHLGGIYVYSDGF